MINIPKDYESVRDACIAKKEKVSGKPATKRQIRDCKRMAAIWWAKKHGKPFPKEEASTDIKLSFMVDANSLNDDFNSTLENLKSDADCGLEYSNTDAGILVEISLPEDKDEFYFTQPFTKEEVNYKLADLDLDGWEINPCWACVHFVTNSYPVTSYDKGFCHLAQGIINGNFSCNFYAKSLIIDEFKDDIDEKKNL